MYNTSYEIAKFPFPINFVLSAVMFWGFLICFKREIKQSKNWYSRILSKSVLLIICIILFFALISSILEGGSNAYTFARQYANGDYELIEGTVSEFIDTEDGAESFVVNGIYFEDVGSLWVGYRIKYKTSIYKDGQRVRISYIYSEDFEQNLIMKIEVAK